MSSLFERKINVPKSFRAKIEKEVGVEGDVETIVQAGIFPRVEEALIRLISPDKLQILMTLRKFTPEMMENITGIPMVWHSEEGDETEVVRNNRIRMAKMLENLQLGNVVTGTNGGIKFKGYVIVKENGAMGNWDDYRLGTDSHNKWPKLLMGLYESHSKFREFFLNKSDLLMGDNGHKIGEKLWLLEFDKIKTEIDSEDTPGGCHLEVRMLETVFLEIYYHRCKMGMPEKEAADLMMKGIDEISINRPLLQAAVYKSIEGAVRNDSVLGARDKEMAWLWTFIEDKANALASNPRRMRTLMYKDDKDSNNNLNNIFVSGGIDAYSGKVEDRIYIDLLAKKLNEDLTDKITKGAVLCEHGENVDLITKSGVAVQLERSRYPFEPGRIAAIEVAGDQVLLYKCLGSGNSINWEQVATVSFRRNNYNAEVRVGYEPKWTENRKWRSVGQSMGMFNGAGMVEVLDCPIQTFGLGKGNVVFNASDYYPVIVNPINYGNNGEELDSWRMPQVRCAKIRV